MIDDERFFAWLDGELDPADATAVEAMVAASPALQSRAEAHRAMKAQLQANFGTILHDPMPAALTAAIRPQANVIDLGAARAARARAPIAAEAQRSWPRWGAMAATLCAGLVGGLMFAGAPSGPVIERDGRMIASGELGRALDMQLASAQTTGEAIRIGLTFRTGSGDICRSFAARSANGVACHDDGAWQVRGLFAGNGAAGADYRMAAGGDPKVMAMIDDMIAGEPFDATREKAARDAAWIR